MPRFFNKTSRKLKNYDKLTRFNIICVEGDDGVGKTTFIKKLIKNSRKNKIVYMHMPTNIPIIIDKNEHGYMDVFDNKLKFLEEYKENLVKKLTQEQLVIACANGYGIINNLLNKNIFIIQDRGIISNIVYSSWSVSKALKKMNIDDRIDTRIKTINYLQPNCVEIIKETLHVFLDDRKFFNNKKELKLNNYNLLNFKTLFMNHKQVDRIKEMYLVFYYLVNKSFNKYFIHTLLLSKYDYYNKYIERLEIFKKYFLKKLDK